MEINPMLIYVLYFLILRHISINVRSQLMRLYDVFKKQGGFELIHRYAKNGSLLTAIMVFIILGKNRTALEILRLSTQLKTKQKLEKKYRKKLDLFEKRYDDSLPHLKSNKVWICWLQGMENAPLIVKKCFKSVKDNLTDRDVVLITADNINDYVQFPDYIIEKWKMGIISHTHLTDLLRLELLIKYGGMWLDATVLCTEHRDNIPDYFFDSDLFFYQNLKPGRDGDAIYISSWLISAKSNNKLLLLTRDLCYEYWKKERFLKDYFLLHDFLSIVLDRHINEWNSIIPRDSSTPHILLLRLFDNYDEVLWDSIRSVTPFHKLSYKFKEEQLSINDTYYQKLIVER